MFDWKITFFIPTRIELYMKKLDELLKEVEMYIPCMDKLNTKVSKADIGWHIVHICLVIDQIAEAVLRSDPFYFKPKFNIKRIFVFWRKRLPRGRAEAPSMTQPRGEMASSMTFDAIQKSFQSIQILDENAQKKQFFLHPVFGQLHKANTIKFLRIHTMHHLIIINEILAG